jgi:DNA-binding NarL/FixJ family response regulator
MDVPQTSRFLKQPVDVTLVAAGLSKRSKEFVTLSMPECHVLESKPNSWRTLRFCKLVGPAILIIDYDALEQLGSQQMPEVEYLSTVEVLVLSKSSDEDIYRVALLAGCSGVLTLDSSPQQLRAVVEAIREGDLWYPRAILAALARRWMLNQSISRKKLTEREEEILRLLGMDQKNQEIADQLFISRETVRWHIRTLYSKIGVSNRSEARQYALKHEESTRAL